MTKAFKLRGKNGLSAHLAVGSPPTLSWYQNALETHTSLVEWGQVGTSESVIQFRTSLKRHCEQFEFAVLDLCSTFKISRNTYSFTHLCFIMKKSILSDSQGSWKKIHTGSSSIVQNLYYSLYIKGFHCITRVGWGKVEQVVVEVCSGCIIPHEKHPWRTQWACSIGSIFFLYSLIPFET